MIWLSKRTQYWLLSLLFAFCLVGNLPRAAVAQTLGPPLGSDNSVATMIPLVRSEIPGRSVRVTLAFKNSGPTTWTTSDDYGLAISGGTNLYFPLPLSTCGKLAPPGTTCEWRAWLRSPAAGADVAYQAQMTRDGRRFGARIPIVLNLSGQSS